MTSELPRGKTSHLVRKGLLADYGEGPSNSPKITSAPRPLPTPDASSSEYARSSPPMPSTELFSDTTLYESEERSEPDLPGMSPVEDDDQERARLYEEERRTRAQITQILVGGGSTDGKMQAVTRLLMDKHSEMEDAKRETQDRETQNARMRAEMDSLNNSNQELYDEAMKGRETIESMQQAMQAMQRSLESSKKGTVSSDKLKLVEEAERAAKEELKAQEARVTLLQQELRKEKSRVEESKRRFGPDWDDRASSEWAEMVQRFLGFTTQENLALRTQVNEFTNFVASATIEDIARYQKGKQPLRAIRAAEQLEQPRAETPPARLTYGTVDRDMADAFETDTQMLTLPEKHVAPWLIRMERRLGRTKPALKRAGKTVQRPSRPGECRRGHSEARAASTYLQYRTKDPKHNNVLQPVGRKAGMAKMHSRKRPRLAKSSDMIRRMEIAAELKHRLPPIPRDLIPEHRLPSAYHKRNEEALAKAAELWSLSDDSSETTETPDEPLPEVKLITVRETTDHYLRRAKEFRRPLYLPKEIKPLSRDERRHWAKVADKWTLGPPRDSKPKKQVRFANKVEFEPTYKEPLPRRVYTRPRPVGQFNWSAVVIALLLILLVATNVYRGPIFSWSEANQRPEDIVAKLRTPGPGEGTNPVVDFEVAKWSDVDPRTFG
ncbi:hypothetical protein BDV18DRAFT_161562 [Aspergillus unguis]